MHVGIHIGGARLPYYTQLHVHACIATRMHKVFGTITGRVVREVETPLSSSARVSQTDNAPYKGIIVLLLRRSACKYTNRSCGDIRKSEFREKTI